jgi:hypothetical protein
MAGRDSFYLEREIDNRLLEALRQALQSSSRVFWITLISAPGRGNTFLLDHLQEHLRKDYSFSSFVTLRVAGGDARSSRPPEPLGPLACALLEKVKDLGLSSLRKLLRRLRDASPGQLARCLGLVVGCALLASLLAGVSEFVTNSGGRSLHNFLWVYLPENWRNFPLWLLASSVVSVPLSLLFLYVSRELMLPVRSVPPSEEDARDFRSADGLSRGLREIVGRKRGAVLLVDESQWLKPFEVGFLDGLLGGVGKRDPRVIVVAVDSEGRDWRERLGNGRPEQFVTLEVPPFDLLELRSIWSARRPPGPARIPGGELGEKQVLEQAQGSVKALLSYHEREVVEEVGSEFRQVLENDIGNVFGLSSLMALQTVRQVPSVTKAETLQWLEERDTIGALTEIGWRKPADPQALLREFSRSRLVRKVGDVCRFDPERRGALLAWLQQHDRPLLAKAHYFWCTSLLRRLPQPLAPRAAGDLSETERHVARSAAWHAARLGLFIENPADFLRQATNLSPAAAAKRSAEVASGLLAAAAILRSDGDLLESRSLISDAADWLREAGSASAELAGQAVDQLWRSYWLSGEPRFREQADGLLRDFPAVESAVESTIHRRHEELMQGRDSSRAFAPKRLGDPFLSNLDALTHGLVQVRQRHGFLLPGLADAGIRFPRPQPGSSDLLPEGELWNLHLWACAESRSWDDLREGIAAWRLRLSDGAPSPGRLGERAEHDLAVAWYHHRLADAWRGGVERDDAVDGLEDAIRAACLAEIGPGEDLREHLWRQSKAAYQRVLRIASLLRWRVLMLKAYFGLGVFLEFHTPESQRATKEIWWEEWDLLFNHCVELEKDLGWIFYRPDLHVLRHQFFVDEGLESSVEDAYNAFLAAKAAHYPSRVVLEWHQRVAGLLNDFGNSDLDRKRSAELHELWARELAALPEAEELRRFRVLRHERAHGLLFAAQAFRLNGELSRADRLLDEADGLLLPAAAGPDAPDEDPDRLREIQLSLPLQRAWVRKGQGREEEYISLVQELWRKMRRSDSDCVIVLRSLVNIEHKKRWLEDPWPPEPGGAVRDDPDNPELSLEDSPALDVRTRYEFRFRQLLSLGGVASMGLSFGQTALDFAEMGTQLSLRWELKLLVVELLLSVWFFFAEIQEVETDELRALKLLILYAPEQLIFRERYAVALVRHQHLLKRELAVREGGEQVDWLALARHVDSYLSVLIDESMREEWIRTVLQSAGAGDPFFPQELEKQAEALRLARVALENGDPTGSARLLAPVLPSDQPVWVFLTQLQVVDLWLRAQIRAAASEEFLRRSRQLRQLAIRFIRQFAGTIPDEQVQQLAFELVEMAQRREDPRSGAVPSTGEPATPARLSA